MIRHCDTRRPQNPCQHTARATTLSDCCQRLSSGLTSSSDTDQVSTPRSAPNLFRRIAVRTGVGVWRHRGGLLLAAFVSAGLVGYVTMTSSGALPTFAAAGPSASGDCADTAMAAIADKSPSVARRAYQCMDVTFQQRVTEQAFTQQMQTARVASVDKLARVSDYKTPTGGTMVYYALEGGGQSIGYIVYLGHNGRVLRIQ